MARMSNDMQQSIAVVIPSYRVRDYILDVIAAIPRSVSRIFVVDDRCPEASGNHVLRNSIDTRVRVIMNETNLGVGGAVIRGYREAIADGAAIIVKLDGDGQMDPGLIPMLVAPIARGDADYTKGNRFFDAESVKSMPSIRLIGNIALSFVTKLSSGYWNLFDPTNGFTAIHARVARQLPLDKISRGYFFESDVLFRLNTLRAVVIDIPMEARYMGEQSSLKVGRQLPVFIANNVKNVVKRIYYNYFLRNFNYATIELVLGLALLTFGMTFGGSVWVQGHLSGTLASAGTVMLAALPTLAGIQLLLGFASFDMNNIPTSPLHRRLPSLDFEATRISD